VGRHRSFPPRPGSTHVTDPQRSSLFSFLRFFLTWCPSFDARQNQKLSIKLRGSSGKKESDKVPKH
jgi:hypothetical protein